MTLLEVANVGTFLDGPAKRLPGVLLYAKVWGSWSHGTQVPASDVDYLAVYQEPTRDLLKIHPGSDTIDGTAPDFQAHELGKFCALLIKGNPGVVECLFTEEMQMMHPVYERLRERRELFLNQRTLNQYLGYCRGQLHRLDAGTRLHSKGGEYNTKWAYHLIRIGLDAERIANGHEPLVMKTGEERDRLMAIRHGEYTPEQVAQQFSEIEKAVAAARKPLPDEANLDGLDAWLWKQRREYLE